MALEQLQAAERHRKRDLPNGFTEVWLDQDGSTVTMHLRHKIAGSGGGGESHWSKCEVKGCLGEAVTKDKKCIAHCSEDNRQKYLQQIKPGALLSFRGVTVTHDLLSSIINSQVFVELDRKIPILISFAGADTQCRLNFEGYEFEEALDFTGATIRSTFLFTDCVFKKNVVAFYSHYNRGALNFVASHFFGNVNVSYVLAEQIPVNFHHCKFEKPFTGDGLAGSLECNQSTFASTVSVCFADAPFVRFNACSVDGDLALAGTVCGSFRAPFLRAASAHQIGPLESRSDCNLSHARFGARTTIEVVATDLDLFGALFMEGGHILVGRARVRLGQLSAGRSLLVSGIKTTEPQTSILTLRDADAGSMTFAHVDMSRCIFYGAHDLRNISIEPTVRVAKAPKGFARRRCIADEFAWRRNMGGYRGRRWNLAGTRIASDPPPREEDGNVLLLPPLTASQVATVYRNLRTSFEAKSDEPGAADFYYGEMEMRRHSSEVGLAERVIVWLYWILSGYGLRASRATMWLILLVVTSGIAMVNAGFAEGQPTYIDGFIFALKAVIPGVQSAAKLTTTGEFIELGLALLGPLLFALSVLALRGRVKR